MDKHVSFHLWAASLREWLSEAIRENRDAVMYHLRLWNLRQQFFLGCYLLCHVLSLLIPFQGTDFVFTNLSTVFLILALIEWAWATGLATLLVDLVIEGVPNLGRGLGRFIEAVVPGGGIGTMTPEEAKRLGLNNVVKAGELVFYYSSLIFTGHILYWCVVWQMNLLDRGPGTGLRFMMLLLLLLLVGISGAKRVPISIKVLTACQVGVVAWFVAIVMQGLGVFTELGHLFARPGYRLPKMAPPVTLWAVLPLLMWAMILFGIAALLQKVLGLRLPASLCALIGVLLVGGAGLKAWSMNKDDMLPAMVSKQFAAGVAESDGDNESVALPDTPFPFEIESCDPKEGILWVGWRGVSYTPLLDKEHLSSKGVEEFHDLTVPSGDILWVRLKAGTQYTWEVNPRTRRYRRDPANTTEADPHRKWKDLVFTGEAWRLRIGACRDHVDDKKFARPESKRKPVAKPLFANAARS